jgi:predicted RNA-binding Zn-ribbon protein involved in translation (DUF1610 family)
MDAINHGLKRFTHPTPAPQFALSSSFEAQRGLRPTMPGNIQKGGRVIVDIRKGERWRCPNPECGSEILVRASSCVQGGSKLRCSCGEIMKKAYVRPELKTIQPANEARLKLEELPR